MLEQTTTVSIDSTGKRYLDLTTEIDQDAWQQKFLEQLRNQNAWRTKDLLWGLSKSAVSGVGLGVLESHAFGYRYPHLKSGGLKDYLTMNTAGDGVFTKFWHPNKIGRSFNDIFDRSAYLQLKTYFNGKWYWAYACHFTIKNIVSTLVRDWAKYGDAFYSFQIDLIVPTEF